MLQLCCLVIVHMLLCGQDKIGEVTLYKIIHTPIHQLVEVVTKHLFCGDIHNYRMKVLNRLHSRIPHKVLHKITEVENQKQCIYGKITQLGVRCIQTQML